MTSRDRDKYRAYEAGNVKRQKRQKREDFLNKQRGTFEKFLMNTNLDKNDTLLVDTPVDTPKQIIESSSSNVEVMSQNDLIIIDDVSISTVHHKQLFHNIDDLINSPKSTDQNLSNSKEESTIVNKNNVLIDFTDPGNWPTNIKNEIRIEIVKTGPCRVLNFNYPLSTDLNNEGRQFSDNYYTRKLKNGETIDRHWLIYSRIKDCVYCFYCKVFQKSNNSLSTSGVRDWRHLSRDLDQHENSSNHLQCCQLWYELKTRLDSGKTIDKEHWNLIAKEKDHWRDFFKRILAAIHYLAKHNDAFRGSSDVLYQRNNGKFLGLVEMMAKFDPVIIEHVRRIKNHETHVHYLGHDIQNTLISMMANNIKIKMIELIKKAKYFSVIMDTTPDISRLEQLSIIIRIVNMDLNDETTSPEIKEYFMDFINIHSTTGLDLSNVLIDNLKAYGLNLNDCRGQSYDNGANMAGKFKGVQARILNQNPRAFFVPCAAHSLNLLLKDAAETSSTAKLFYGTIERVYTVFSASTGRWDILKKHCSKSVKRWAETRWESRFDAVKAIRYQLNEIIDALGEVSETTNDSVMKSESNSLGNEINSYEFLLSLIIWYDILSKVNIVSKSFQAPSIDLGVSSDLLNGLIIYLQDYRENGFKSAKAVAKQIIPTLGIEEQFKNTRIGKKKHV